MIEPRKISEKDINAALALIEPLALPEKRELCRTTISQCGDKLCAVADEFSATPSAGVLRKELAGLADDLKKARAQIRKYSQTCRALVFDNPAKADEFVGTPLEKVAFYQHKLAVPPGGHRWDNVAAIAETFARDLLLSFSSKRPTQTEGGPYYALTKLLYKAATGKALRGVSKYCGKQRGRYDVSGVLMLPVKRPP
jgi:hypothetical protein